MSLRGRSAIVGIGELPTRRSYQGRTMYGLCAEAARLAIADAGLNKADIDGLIVDGGAFPAYMAEYIGIKPQFATGVSMGGASGATGVAIAASAIEAGYCNTVLIVIGQARGDATEGGGGGGAGSITAEFERPFGPAQGAGTGYALMYRRHMHEYGTKPEQLAKLAADQRFNALTNENAAFQGQPISVEDVLNSRYVNEPLHLLE